MEKEVQNQDENLFNDICNVIDNSRTKIASQVNAGVCYTYYEIGRILEERKLESKHGSAVVERLSADLKARYPKMGFSPRQLWNMKKFYERFRNADLKLLQAVAVLPWSDNLLFLNKNLSDEEIAYYAKETVSKGWNRDLLLNAIKLEMYESNAKNQDNNFLEVLPSSQGLYANEVFKETVNLGFLEITEPVLELELENRIMERIKQFLLEMGKGFTFIGNQHVLEFNGKDYRVDLLLYHRKLHCLVAIDLKIGEFKPEYVGKMNFYLSILDEKEKAEDENPSIGIIMCAEKDHFDVQMALKDVCKPIGVTDYKLLIPTEEIKQIVQEELNKK